MFDSAVNEIREAIPGLPPQQKKVCVYFCEHPETLGVYSLTDFASRIGTSGPTVNKVCQVLGYGGFLDFSRSMQRFRNNEISHVSCFHNSRFVNEKNKRNGRMAQMILEKDEENTRKFRENYPLDSMEKCISLMNKCSTIYVIGKMSAYPAAIYFEQLLSKVTPKLFPMHGADIVQAAAISRIDKNSLVFCMAFPRYPKHVIELSREAAQKGASIVAITKNNKSPLADISDILFTVDVEMFSYIDIMGPVFSLTNAICLEFGLAQSVQSGKNLAKYDKVVEDAYFMSPSKNGAKIS